MTKPHKKDHRDEFTALCGLWSDEELREFEKNTACFSVTDSPAWHGDVLRETEDRVASGEEKTLDWEATKKYLHSCGS